MLKDVLSMSWGSELTSWGGLLCDGVSGGICYVNPLTFMCFGMFNCSVCSSVVCINHRINLHYKSNYFLGDKHKHCSFPVLENVKNISVLHWGF